METITVNMPTSLDDLTLGQFQRLSLLSEEKDEDIKTRAYCSIVYSMPGEIVKRTPKVVLNQLVRAVDEVLSQQPEFINRFTLYGVEYGFIPDLDRMTAGEWVDMETCGFDPDKLHKLMAIFYRPIIETKGEKYLIASYTGDEDSEVFKDSPASIITGALLFFSRIVCDCMPYILSLNAKTQTYISSGVSLAKSGAGIVR